MRYLKKPVVIEAVQFNGQNAKEIMDWAHKCMLPEMNAIIRISPFNHSIVVNTLEGLMEATQGDWIIKGVKGEFYPCKDEIFKATYDEVIDAKTDIKPCPFCGENPSKHLYEEKYFCYCLPCDDPEYIPRDKWNNAYCWQRIEHLEADYSSEVQAKELAIEKLVALEKQLDIERTNVFDDTNELREKIRRFRGQLFNLLSQLEAIQQINDVDVNGAKELLKETDPVIERVEQHPVCKCGDFKDQHENNSGPSKMLPSLGEPRCRKYRFHHKEDRKVYKRYI